MDIIDALSADQGVICFVGAGGKKTSIYALAGRLDQAIVTATVRIPIFDGHVSSLHVTEDPTEVLEHDSPWPLGLVPAREGNRYLGYEPTVIDSLAEIARGPILVKADGARTRWLKAPNDREPQIPASATVVVPIASAHVVGQPLDDTHVHRVNRVSDISGLQPGDRITADAVGRVIASSEGGMKGIPAGATAIPLINMVDNEQLATTARTIADVIHAESTVDHVVLAAMRQPNPLVEVV